MPPRLLKKEKPTDDDEMFLDADGELSSEVAIDTGLPIKRKKQQIQGHRHIVYKRNGNQEDTMSDYGKLRLFAYRTRLRWALKVRR